MSQTNTYKVEFWFHHPPGGATYNIQPHFHFGPPEDERLNRILYVLQEQVMPGIQDFNTLLQEMNTVTNTIAANIQALLDQLAAGGMNAADEEAVRAKLSEQVDALKAVAANSANPIPPVPPV